ncbi:MAG: homoserine dehydrogenase, partial [Betaproteobacteria bacterium]|nr:homoserine dehydrogenase [Betaproteobacteria bacterium]
MTFPLRIGVIGLGTVGAAVVGSLQKHAHFIATRAGRAIEVVAVSARNKSRDRGLNMDKIAWFDDPLVLAKAEGIDCIVELVGGADGLPKDIVETALRTGKHVVTANKALLAKHGNALMKRAEEHGRALNFEAAVAGGIPVIKTLRESLAGNQVSRVSGILNGTCNYILSRMEMEGLTFEDCLKDAQRLGYAEADPTFDVGGFDTAHKLALLTSLAFGSEIDADSVYVEGIASIKPLDLVMADELGYRIKLLGVAERNSSGIEQRVHPTMVPKSTAIAQVMGVTNAVTIDADIVGEVTLVGPGAGGSATASSVLSDLIDIARGMILPPLGMATSALTATERAQFFLRRMHADRFGQI